MIAKRTGVVEGVAIDYFARMDCKRWSCEYCGPRRASALRRSIAIAARTHGLSRFLTLTQDPRHLRGVADPVRHIRNTWRKFRVYLKRKYHVTVSFIAVIEFTKAGLPHLHVLLDRFVPQPWIREAWDNLGGGRIVHIEQVADLDRIGWYLGKYLTKDAILSGPQGLRRFSTSRNIHLREKAEPAGWILLEGGLEGRYALLNANADNVVSDDDGRIRSFEVRRGWVVGDDVWPDGDNQFQLNATKTKVRMAGIEWEVIEELPRGR